MMKFYFTFQVLNVMHITIENNGQVEPHFAQLHVAQIFDPIVKFLCPNNFLSAYQGAPRCDFEDF